MNEKLKRYLDNAFRSAPKNARTAELKEEILQNVNEKYNDLIAAGKSEDDAYRIAINGIGDLSELLGNGAPKDAQKQDGSAEKAIRGAIWFLSVTAYLWVSIQTGAWGVTWMIFGLTFAINQIVRGIYLIKQAKSKEEK